MKSYTREFKLSVIKWHEEHGNIVSGIADKFSVDRKRVREWVKQKTEIEKMKTSSRKNKSGRKAAFPLTENELHSDFLKLRQEGQAVKSWWFKSRAKQLVKQHYPNKTFSCSDRWLRLFFKRKRISLRRKTHTSQRIPEEATPLVLKFHKQLMKVRKNGVYTLKDIANMDQTPLPFILDDGKTYSVTNEKDVVCKTGSPGLDKRQSTAQLTVFADSVPRVKTLLIFRGKGMGISKQEKDNWDKRVTVTFQKNAWCDEKVMLE